MPFSLRRDGHFYTLAIGLIFIFNGAAGLAEVPTTGWHGYALELVTWIITFWLTGKIIRRPQAAN